jgi:hypothetical protein
MISLESCTHVPSGASSCGTTFVCVRGISEALDQLRRRGVLERSAPPCALVAQERADLAEK